MISIQYLTIDIQGGFWQFTELRYWRHLHIRPLKLLPALPVFTDYGVRLLGRTIREAREAQQPKLTLLVLLDRLESVGVKTSYGTLQTLEKPKDGYHPDWEIINAIAFLGFIINPASGMPFTANELMLIACEWLDPRTGQTKQGSTIMTAEQPNEFVRMVQQQYPTPAELAAASGLSEEEADALYQGQPPGVVLLGLIAPILEKEGGGSWRTEELQEFRDRVWGLVPKNENPPVSKEQEDGHQVGNGSAK